MTTQQLAVRPFVAQDERAVVALWRECGLVRPWNDPVKDIARKLTVQPELFLVGTLDGRVVATIMAGFEGHRGWINYLAVAPACQRRGYATALMERAEQGLLQAGCPKVSLQVRRGNDAAGRFYDSLGFVTDDVVCYGKRLISDMP